MNGDFPGQNCTKATIATTIQNISQVKKPKWGNVGCRPFLCALLFIAKNEQDHY